jgi:carboxyl-terminal processing protease
MRSKKKFLRIGFVAIIFLAVLSLKIQIGSLALAEDRYSDLQVFSKVLNLIQQYYVEEVDVKKLIQGSIKGMLRELDPHSSYMGKEVFKEFESETSGNFAGIGIEISIQKGVLTVISPIEDTPAWKAGVKSGDRIIAINGESTKGYSLADASQKMRGDKGTPVTLKIVREGEEMPFDIVITRGNVKVASVKYTDFEDGYAYIKLTSFIEQTGKDLEKILQKHKDASKGKISGIVLDLRKNPGGLLDQAIDISSLFLKEGTIVSTVGRNSKDREVAKVKKPGAYVEFPLIVLVDRYSASASEILSGALRDNKRALIMGERTFGKGSVQSVIRLGDGGGLKLTVARYFTPNGISIQAEGITPDVEIQDVDTEAFSKAIVRHQGEREGDIEGHLKGEKEKNNVKGKSSTQKEDSLVAWWNDVGSLKEKSLSPKLKILKDDYQVYQAFNYLKTWKTIRDLNQ